MTFYCHSGSCLRAYLLRYFGENAPEHCDNCSVCSTQTEKVDVSGEARIIFLFLRDLRYPLGAATVIDALRGSESERVLRHRLERADGYGRLRSVSAARLRAIFNHLTAARVIWNRRRGSIPRFRWGRPRWNFWNTAAPSRCAWPGRRSAPTRARRHCPRIWRCSSA